MYKGFPYGKELAMAWEMANGKPELYVMRMRKILAVSTYSPFSVPALFPIENK